MGDSPPIGAHFPPKGTEQGQGSGRAAPGGGTPLLLCLALTSFPLPQMADCGGLPQISQVSPTCHHSPAGGQVPLCPVTTYPPPPRLLLPYLTVTSDDTADTLPFMKGACGSGLDHLGTPVG